LICRTNISCIIFSRIQTPVSQYSRNFVPLRSRRRDHVCQPMSRRLFHMVKRYSHGFAPYKIDPVLRALPIPCIRFMPCIRCWMPDFHARASATALPCPYGEFQIPVSASLACQGCKLNMQVSPRSIFRSRDSRWCDARTQ
jgi:hypothetical protein